LNDLFRTYMFTRTNEAEHDQLRERLLADSELSDQFREQENDWIDACAAGTLPPADAALLHQHLADTGQLHRLTTAVALARPRLRRESIFPYALGCAAAVLVCFGIAFQEPRSTPVTSGPPPGAVVTAFLAPGTLRSGQGMPVVSARQDQKVELQLLYQDTAPTGVCEVTMNPLGNPTPVWKESGPCGLDFHIFLLPAGLDPGRYTIDLRTKDGQALHNYAFQFTR
jgi:hypothetical protein